MVNGKWIIIFSTGILPLPVWERSGARGESGFEQRTESLSMCRRVSQKPEDLKQPNAKSKTDSRVFSNKRRGNVRMD
jgi:hypothetical protein